ncbi:MAG: signal recognition particle receptor subunit alpha [Candidatus Marsarchaeota archaeon]|nr:signal recognition particle receptor subunit alpha [Candidatus Marsarchaeota archaeon]
MDLGEGLRKAIARLTGATIIDAKTIREFNKELQRALISADVNVELVLALTKKLEDAALKEKIPGGVSAKDYITNMLYEQLISLMGESFEPVMKPKRILLLGLYGSGKTTTSAKLARYYQERGLSSALIACDVSRPAAYEQLETLAKQAGVGFFGIKGESDVRKIIKEAKSALKDKKVLICDTSGRNALDSELIEQLKVLVAEFKPDEKTLVINADTGQVAGKQASEFDNAVKLTGVIVTKLDGSGKGGGALSAVSAAKVGIEFIGTGEKLNALELYDSKKFVGRLLGMPDLESLVANVQQAIKDANVKPEEMQSDELSYSTFYTQLKALNKMGPLSGMMSSLGVSAPKEALEQSENKLKRYKSIIDSMTPQEREEGSLISQSNRIKRIANGSGSTEKEVREMIADFNKMKKMYKLMKNDRNVRKQFSKFMPK